MYKTKFVNLQSLFRRLNNMTTNISKTTSNQPVTIYKPSELLGKCLQPTFQGKMLILWLYFFVVST